MWLIADNNFASDFCISQIIELLCLWVGLIQAYSLLHCSIQDCLVWTTRTMGVWLILTPGENYHTLALPYRLAPAEIEQCTGMFLAENRSGILYALLSLLISWSCSTLADMIWILRPKYMWSSVTMAAMSVKLLQIACATLFQQWGGDSGSKQQR